MSHLSRHCLQHAMCVCALSCWWVFCGCAEIADEWRFPSPFVSEAVWLSSAWQFHRHPVSYQEMNSNFVLPSPPAQKEAQVSITFASHNHIETVSTVLQTSLWTTMHIGCLSCFSYNSRREAQAKVTIPSLTRLLVLCRQLVSWKPAPNPISIDRLTTVCTMVAWSQDQDGHLKMWHARSQHEFWARIWCT